MQKIITQWVDALLVKLGMTELQADTTDQWIVFGIIVALAVSVDIICRGLLIKVVRHIVKSTHIKWDDIIFNESVMRRMCNIITPVLIHVMLPIAFPEETPTLRFVMDIVQILIVITVTRFINSALKALFEIAETLDHWQGKPLKGILQTGQVVMILICIILIVSILLDKSPTLLLTGLGASAAILSLVFKDSILGLVAGVQLSANNMLKVGDWISMPKYGADGVVIEVALTIVKVRNWDNTVTTIPPYLLISDSFQNWQPMFDSGGRRVKRHISIDMSSISFCSHEQIEHFRRSGLLSEFIDTTNKFIDEFNTEHIRFDEVAHIDGVAMTNIGLFRNYLISYLRRRADVNQSMTLMVRQLQPTEYGLPIELYFFTDTVAWTEYERIQADVFDHVLAVVPQFGLRVFQSPAGRDLKNIIIPNMTSATTNANSKSPKEKGK